MKPSYYAQTVLNEGFLSEIAEHASDISMELAHFLRQMTSSEVSMAIAKVQDSRTIDSANHINKLVNADTAYADSFTITAAGVDKATGL